MRIFKKKPGPQGPGGYGTHAHRDDYIYNFLSLLVFVNQFFVFSALPPFNQHIFLHFSFNLFSNRSKVQAVRLKKSFSKTRTLGNSWCLVFANPHTLGDITLNLSYYPLLIPIFFKICFNLSGEI